MLQREGLGTLEMCTEANVAACGGGGEGLRAEGRVEKGGGPRYGWSGQNPGFGFCALTRALVWSMSSPGKGHYRAAWFGGQSMGFGQLDFKTWSLLKCVLGHAH